MEKNADFLRTKPHHNISMIEGRIPPTHIGVVVEQMEIRGPAAGPTRGRIPQGKFQVPT